MLTPDKLTSYQRSTDGVHITMGVGCRKYRDLALPSVGRNLQAEDVALSFVRHKLVNPAQRIMY